MTTSKNAPLALELCNVDKAFYGVKANDNVSFELARGEVHALLGLGGFRETEPETLRHERCERSDEPGRRVQTFVQRVECRPLVLLEARRPEPVSRPAHVPV